MGGGGGHSKAPISLEEGVGREQGGKRYIFLTKLKVVLSVQAFNALGQGMLKLMQ